MKAHGAKRKLDIFTTDLLDTFMTDLFLLSFSRLRKSRSSFPGLQNVRLNQLMAKVLGEAAEGQAPTAAGANKAAEVAISTGSAPEDDATKAEDGDDVQPLEAKFEPKEVEFKTKETATA